MSDSEKLDALLLKMDKLDTIEQEVSKINLMLENEILSLCQSPVCG